MWGEGRRSRPLSCSIDLGRTAGKNTTVDGGNREILGYNHNLKDDCGEQFDGPDVEAVLDVMAARDGGTTLRLSDLHLLKEEVDQAYERDFYGDL